MGGEDAPLSFSELQILAVLWLLGFHLGFSQAHSRFVRKKQKEKRKKERKKTEKKKKRKKKKQKPKPCCSYDSTRSAVSVANSSAESFQL